MDNENEPASKIETPVDPEFARAAPRSTNPADRTHTVSNSYIRKSEKPHQKPARREPLPFFKWALIGVLYAIGFVVGTAALSYGYLVLQLPSAEELKARQFDFQTTSILDADGNTLWEISPPDFGERYYVPLDAISPMVISATIATEDRHFYQNIGVDPLGMLRAVYFNVTTGSIVAGGSTITQQLVRNVFFSPEERMAKSIRRKIKEAVLATETTRYYGKDDILEIYLNQIYYGNRAYGIEAASQVYFNKHAADLSLAEASLLVGLPQQPAFLDPFTRPDAVKERQNQVLRLMTEAGYISAEDAERVRQQPVLNKLQQQKMDLQAPHFVMFVREILENTFPDGDLFKRGLQVQTSLDPQIQSIAENALVAQLDVLSSKNISSGAVVVLDAHTGAILAMVGSPSFNDPDGGQINMAVWPRQPGSTFKPVVYLAAFQYGWTPETILRDERIVYSDGQGGDYIPTNADGKYLGEMTVRVALANSRNVPALKALEFVGIDRVKALAHKMGITSLTDENYGLSLALGSAEVSLLEMTGVYQVLANGGVKSRPYAIIRATDESGTIMLDNTVPQTETVAKPEQVYFLTDILSDNEARMLTMRRGNPLELPFPAAVKTGTTNEFRDAWTIGYTSDFVVGVWLGNSDATPMDNVSGLTGAAPVWHRIMVMLYETRPITQFERPDGKMDLTHQ